MSEILIVDDDRKAARALQLRLADAGYRSLAVSSGADADQKYRALRPRLVILDAAMPDMSGFEVCQRIRDADPCRETKVMFLSGASTPSEEYVSRCIDVCDADGFFRKPYDFADVLAFIRSLWLQTDLVEAAS